MKRIALPLLLFLSMLLPLSAKENWIISTSVELPYHEEAFSPGISFKADVLMFEWDLQKDPESDGYGISIEAGMLFPIRKPFTGTSPCFKLGVIGRKDYTDHMSLDVKSHVVYALSGKSMPGGGMKSRRIVYNQNIGLDVSAAFVYRFSRGIEFSTGMNVGMLFPLEERKKQTSPDFNVSVHAGVGWNIP